jgi:hypothetical protein
MAVRLQVISDLVKKKIKIPKISELLLCTIPFQTLSWIPRGRALRHRSVQVDPYADDACGEQDNISIPEDH